MNEGRWPLPEGWRWETLGALGEVVGGGTPSTSVESNFAPSGSGVPWLTPADLSKDKRTHVDRGSRDISDAGLASSGARLVPQGSVLFTSRAPIGYCAIAANPISTNQGFKSIVLDSRRMVPEFLRYYLVASIDYAESFASGSTFKELSAGKMRELVAPVAPLEDQRRIVAHLDACFERTKRAKKALDEVPALLDRLRQSILAAAFRGDLTADWRAENPNVEPASELLKRIRVERRRRWEEAEFAKMVAKGKAPKDDKWKAKYEEPEPVDESELPELPEGWCWATLEDLADVVDPQPSHRTPPEYADGVPYVGIGDVAANGRVDTTNARKVSPEVLGEHRERYSLLDGDFMFGKIGTLGQPCRLFPPFDYTLSANVILVQPRSPFVDGDWLLNYMSSPHVEALLAAEGRATSQSAFGIKKARGLRVPLAPQEEQAMALAQINATLARRDLVSLGGALASAHLLRLERAVLATAFGST